MVESLNKQMYMYLQYFIRSHSTFEVILAVFLVLSFYFCPSDFCCVFVFRFLP